MSDVHFDLLVVDAPGEIPERLAMPRTGQAEAVIVNTPEKLRM